MDITQKISGAAAFILSKVSLRPTIGMVLGSGLGDYAETLEDSVKIPYSEIPNFPVPTVPGHSGAMVFGNKNGQNVVVLQGRIHYFEGLSMREITLPIRVLAAHSEDIFLCDRANAVELLGVCEGVEGSGLEGEVIRSVNHFMYLFLYIILQDQRYGGSHP